MAKKTAKKMVLELAHGWSEEQAEVALRAAEGIHSRPPEGRLERHRAAMERAAALRATQSKVFDAAALVREARDEMDKRGT